MIDDFLLLAVGSCGREAGRMYGAHTEVVLLVQFEGNDVAGHGTFFHSPKTRELDEVLGDILHKIIGN